MNRVPAAVATGERTKRATAVERTPMVIRSADDLRRLAAAPKALRRLPRNGVVMAIPGLDVRVQNAFGAQVGRYARACGCAAAGATFLLAGAAAAIYAVILLRASALPGAIHAIGAAIIVVPVLTFAVKFLSLSLARIRFRRACAQMLRLLPVDA